jgi:ribosomal protein L33
MPQRGKYVTVLLRSTAKNPNDPKRRTGSTYVAKRLPSQAKLKGVKKYDPVTQKHELFDEEKAKN